MTGGGAVTRTGSARPSSTPIASQARARSAEVRATSLCRRTTSVFACSWLSGAAVPAITARSALFSCASAMARARSEAEAISSAAVAQAAACTSAVRSCSRAASTDSSAACAASFEAK